MSQDTEDLAARLAALEGTTGKKAGRPRPSPMTALLGIGGIAVAGLLAWVALQPAAPVPMPTAAPEEFQTTGSDGKPRHLAGRTGRIARTSP